MHRRKFLKIIGGTAALGTAGTYIWAAPTAKSARLAWRNAGEYNDPMRFALSHAILAPNPHNRQPWLVELVNEDEAVLYCDTSRHLPITDPLDRQITIGLGCFLEQFTIAAWQKNRLSNITLFEQGGHKTQLDLRPVARIKLVEGKVDDTGLFQSIISRQTDRSPYSKAVPSDLDLEGIKAAAGLTASITNAPSLTSQIREICANSARIEFMTPHIHEESASLMRVGRKAVAKSPDGISIEGPMIELLNLGGALNPTAMRDHNSTSFKQGLNMYQKAVETSHSFLWITAPTISRTDQIKAGQAYLRANLKATELGLSMHPLSQCLQEYPEMKAQLAAIHKLLNINTPNRIQMLARIGYGKAKKKSPRWPLETRLR